MVIPDLPADIRKRLELPRTGEINAIFMKLPNRDDTYRDALTFENGRTILMNDLPLNLCMTGQEEQSEGSEGRRRHAPLVPREPPIRDVQQ